MYNPPDTVENNLITGTGHYVPDDMDEAQTMRFQVMSVLTAYPNHVSSDFRNISNGVKRWTRRLKGEGTDKDHCVIAFCKWDPYWIGNGTNSETTFRLLPRHMRAQCRTPTQV